MADDATLIKRRARRRLVGAIALVVFVVIVLPLVLDQEQKPNIQTLSVQIPSQDGGPFNTRVLPPLSAPPAPQAESAPKAAPEQEKEVSKPAETAPVPKAKAAPKPAAKTKGSAKTDVAEARRAEALLNDEAYVVPLGVFSNPDNARQVREKAKAAGIASYAEKIKGPQGEQTRVRAGPFGSRGAAEKAHDKLKSLGLDVGQVAQR